MSWDPISHVPPLKPIDINPRHPVTIEPEPTIYEVARWDMMQTIRTYEAERIWRAVVATAESTNTTAAT